MPHNQHVYVVLRQKGRCYISDAGNKSSDPETLAQIEARFGQPLIHLPNVGNVGVDQCITGAGLIGLEMLRFLRLGFVEPNFTFPRGRKARTISAFHKYRSASTTARGLPELKCTRCGLRLTNLPKRKRAGHKRKCIGE